MPTRREPITIRVDPAVLDDLQEVADCMGITRAEAGARCLRNGVDDLKRLTGSKFSPTVIRLMSVATESDEQRDELLRVAEAIEEQARQRRAAQLPYGEGAT